MSSQKNGRWYLVIVDLVLIVVAGMLLYNGSAWQFSNKYVDAAIYQCYATAFWEGPGGLQQLPKEQCAFLDNKSILQSSLQSLQKYHVPHPIVQIAEGQMNEVQLHTLPREYPVLALLAFSVPLIAPSDMYQEAYAIWSALIIAVVYFLLVRFASRWSAVLFLLYMVIAGWSTAVSRFDTFPAAASLVALILANQKKWTWAYVCIAVGTLFKLYPVILLPVFFIAQQQQQEGKWYTWARWKAAVLGFVAVMGVFLALSLVISIPGTIGAFKYFSARPLEIESLPGTLVWLGKFVGIPYHYLYAFVSMNVESPLSKVISPLFTVLLIAGLLLIFWLQFRKRLSLNMAALTTIALVLATGKILSPQYMIWIIPLVAYVGKVNWRWIVPWLAAMAITYYIYPVLYNRTSPPPEELFAYALVRGLILAGFVVVVIITAILPPRGEQSTVPMQDNETGPAVAGIGAEKGN